MPKPSSRGRAWALGALAMALAACQASPSTPNRKRPTSPAAAASPVAVPSGFALLSPRSMAEGVAARWQGEVRLISDHGGGIISNHSSGLISDHGGGIISNHSSGIISNHSSGLVSNNGSSRRLFDAPWPGRALAQADGAATSPGQESRLAEAQVAVFDLSGRVILRPDGKPLAALTDAQGRFSFEGQVPKGEALVLRVALEGGGLLRALWLPGQGPERNLDTASSLGSSFLLDDMLVGQRELLAKLPPAELARLDESASTARLRLGSLVPQYGVEESLKLAQRLKQEDAGFGQQLETIRSILLAGQVNLGAGRLATEVSLTLPQGLWPRADGGLEVLERLDRRVRRVNADGTLSNHALTGPSSEQPTTVTATVADGQDGLWVADEGSNRVWHVDAKREAKVVLGAPGALGALPGLGAQVALQGPGNLALAPQGGLFLGEWIGGRLIHLKADGQAVELPPPVPVGAGEALQSLGLASWPDGSLVWAFARIQALVPGELGRPKLVQLAAWPRDAQGQWAASPWPLPAGVGLENGILALRGRWLAQADGQVVVARRAMHDVVRLSPTGQLVPLAGQAGKAGTAGEGGPATQALLNAPWELAQDAQGRLLVAESGAGMVRRVEADGRLVRVAGAPSGGELVEGKGGVAINGPGGLALDPQGRLYFAEGGGGQVQRVVSGKVEPFAGNQPGDSGDGGLASQAQFDGPTAVACDAQGRVFILDGQNRRVRVVEPNGIVRTVAGGGNRLMRDGGAVPMPATEWRPQHLQAIAIDPQGRPCIADVQSNVVVRLEPLGAEPYGLAVPIAGVGGKGQPTSTNEPDRAATATPLAVPTALAFDRSGRLLIGEGGSFVVRRLEANGILTRVAGLPWREILPQVITGADLRDPEGTQALQARFVAITSMAVDPQGRILVGEAGTPRLQDLINATNLPGFKLGPAVGARIRRIEADGSVITLAGDGGRVLKDAEGEDTLRWPSSLVFDPQGRLVVADFLRNQLRLLPLAALN